jgi:hypothetical protein
VCLRRDLAAAELAAAILKPHLSFPNLVRQVSGLGPSAIAIDPEFADIRMAASAWI